MIAEPLILTETDGRGVAWLTFNRLDRHNALNAEMIELIAQAIECFGRSPDVRMIVLRANGKHFTAGADISEPGNAADEPPGAGQKPDLIDALKVLTSTPKPSLALVHGACIGGGAAWAAACDMVLASEDAFFAIPEVRLGFAPGPLVALFGAAMGTRAAYRYCLSGERFGATEALRMGLVHLTCPAGGLEAAAAAIIEALLAGGPQAQGATQKMLADLSPYALDADEMRDIRTASTRRRHSAEAREGSASFRQKRKPAWYPGDE